jgi:hypothetical protein
MKFVATKTAEQLDLQALRRVRERLVSQRTGIINQIRAFLLERGIAVRQDSASYVLSCRASWPRLWLRSARSPVTAPVSAVRSPDQTVRSLITERKFPAKSKIIPCSRV